jgi:hypothetical protein
MTATFTLTSQDFSRLQKIIVRRFRRRLAVFSPQFLLRVVVWMSVGFAFAGYTRLIAENPEIAKPLQVVAVLIVVAAVAIALMPYLSQAMLRKHMLSPTGAFLSPQTVEFTEKALVVTSAVARSEIAWAGMHSRDEDEENYYLFIDPLQALVLPRQVVEPLLSEFKRHTSHLNSDA